MGAGTAASRWDWSPLKGRRVIVVADKDEAGRTHADDVAAQLVNVASSVEIAEPAVGKDISDHITAGKGLDELEAASSLLDQLGFSSERLDAQRFPQLEQIVPGIIVEGVTVLAGPPKVGKSFMVGNIAIAVVSGGKALGFIDVAKRPVLVLALEDGQRRLQDRYREINGGSIPPGITFVTRATPAECFSVMTEYLQRHGHEKPLIVLDTLGKAKPQKQSGQEAYLVDYELGGKFKALAESWPGSAILIIHHTRKENAADFVDMLSGTQGIGGSVDSIVVLSRKRGETDAALNVVGRDVKENGYALVAKDGHLWQLDGTSLAEAADRLDARRNDAAQTNRIARLGAEMRKVVELINQRGQITAEEIEFKLGLTPKRLSTITNRLVDGDFIVRIGRGKYESLSYAETHPLSSEVSEVSEDGEVGDVDEVVVENLDLPGNTTLTSLTTLTTTTSLTSERDRERTNTCPCGAPLTSPRSIELGRCVQCRSTGR